MVATAAPKPRSAGTRAPATLLVLEPVLERLDLEPALLTPGVHTIGSDPACAVSARVHGLESVHCEITVCDGRARITRCDRRTWLNRGPANHSTLRTGDRLVVGPVEFRVTAMTSAPAALRSPDVPAWDALQEDFAPRPAALPAPSWTSGRARLVNPDPQLDGDPGSPLDASPPSLRPEQRLAQECRNSAERRIEETLCRVDRLLNDDEDAAPTPTAEPPASDAERRLALLGELMESIRRQSESVLDRTRDVESRETRLTAEEARLRAEWDRVALVQSVHAAASERLEAARRELARDQDEIRELSQRLEARRLELEQDGARLDRLDVELRRARIELERRRDECELAESALRKETPDAPPDAAASAIDAERSRLESVADDQARAAVDLSRRERELESRRCSLDDERHAVDALSAAMESESQRLEAVSLEHGRLAAELTRRTMELDAQARSLEDERRTVAALSAAVDSESRRLESLAEEQADLSGELARRTAEIDARAAELDVREAALRECEELLQSRDSWAAAVDEIQGSRESRLGEQMKALDAREREVRERADSLSSETARLARLEADLRARGAAIEERLRDLAWQETVLDERDAEIDRRATRLDEREADLALLEGRLEAADWTKSEPVEPSRDEPSQEEFPPAAEFLSAELAERASELQKRANDLECQANLLDERSQRLGLDAARVNAREQELTDREVQLDARDLAQEAAACDLAARLSDAEAREEELLGARSALEIERTALDSARQELAAERAALDAARKDLEAHRTDADVERRGLDALRAELDAERRRIDGARDEFEQAERELLDRRAACRGKEAELSSRAVELDTANGSIEARRLELDQRAQALDAADAERREQEQRLELDRTALVALQEQIELQRRQIELGYESRRQDDLELEAARAEWREQQSRSQEIAEERSPAASNLGAEAAEGRVIDDFDRTGIGDEPSCERDADSGASWSATSDEALRARVGTATHSDDDRESLAAGSQPRSDERVLQLRSQLAELFHLREGDRDSQEVRSPLLRQDLDADSPPDATELPESVADVGIDLNGLLASLDRTPADGSEAERETPPPPDSRPVELHDIEDESSVARYMESLLARSRRGAPESAPAPSRSAPERPAERNPRPPRTELAMATTGGADDETPTTAPLGMPEPKRTVDRDAVRAHLDSLRQVANASARQAIDTHSIKRLKTQTRLRIGLAAAACVFAAALLGGDAYVAGSGMKAAGCAFAAIGLIVAVDLAAAWWKAHSRPTIVDSPREEAPRDESAGA